MPGGQSSEELLALAGVSLAAIPIALVCAVFVRGSVRGLTAAMLASRPTINIGRP